MRLKAVQTKDECGHFSDLLSDAFGNQRAWSDQELSQFCQDPKMHMLLAYFSSLSIEGKGGRSVVDESGFQKEDVGTLEEEVDEPIACLLYCVVLDEVELFALGVRRQLQGQGWGERTLRHWIQELRQEGLASVFLEVRSRNTAARHLYDKLGFEEIFRRKNYYSDNLDDAIVMRKNLERSSYGDNTCN